jgi:heavy metal sensor kinase
LKIKSSLFRTLPARLTFFYTLLFAVLSLAVFEMIDNNLETNLLQRIDTEFSGDGSECVEIYRESGIEGLRREVFLETEGEGDEHVFIRVYSPEFKVVASSDLSRWQGLPEHTRQLEAGRSERFKTIYLPGNPHRVRIFFQELGDGHLLQFGKILTDDEHLLQDFRRMFYLSFAVMLLAGILFGFYLAKNALSGIQRVRRGADQMSRGDLSQRIALNGGSEEIRNLTHSFNRMQDRIQSLISELQNVTNNVAHDLRSPVTRMRGLAETTLTGGQNLEEYRDMAGAVVEECDRLVGMINIMLEIAETDAGLRPLAHAPVDMNEMVLDVAELYSSVANDKGIALTTKVPEGPLIVPGDRRCLQRALANLLDNAIKFTQQDGEVEVSAFAENRSIIVTITDNGPGIPADDLSRIYDRFFRGDQSRSSPGNGLGLSLVQSIIHAHGGEISVRNVANQGTRAKLSIPIH